MTNEQIQSMLFPQTHSQNHNMSSIEQIIADYKRKQAEAEAKKVVMPRSQWLEYLPKEYRELCVAVHVPEKADAPVASMYDAILYGGRDVEKWPFWHEFFWSRLTSWAKNERDTLPPIPGIHKAPVPWPQPDLSKKPVVAVEKPIQKEYHPLADVSVRDKPTNNGAADGEQSKKILAGLDPHTEWPTDQPTEVYSTRHTIPYNGGNLQLFASL